MKRIGMAVLAGLVLQALPALAQSDALQPEQQLSPADFYVRPIPWSAPPSGGWLNLSSFTYRDLNLNGIYDMGDRPLSFITVLGMGPDGTPILRRTNTDGFANFRLSASDESMDITEEGEYVFEAVVPPGWRVTSGNAIQTRRVFKRTGAPSDMATDDLAQPIGFAPELTISGHVRGVENVSLTATGPDGETRPVEPGEMGHFVLPASKGVWTLTFSGPGGKTLRTREVTVEDAPVALSRMDLNQALPDPLPQPVTAGFDDLIQSNAVLELPNGYKGLGWWNWVVVNNRFYDVEGYVNGVRSGEFGVYNSSGFPAKIFSETPFDFVGGYFTVARLLGQGDVLQIKAWRGEELAYEDAVTLSALGPVEFDADYRSVTRIEFSTRYYWQAMADDFSFRLPAGASAGETVAAR